MQGPCDITTIPSFVTPPQLLPLSAAQVKELHNIFYDLETDGLGFKPNIIQIAACDGKRRLNRYVMPPLRRLPAKITAITGLSIRGSDMYLREAKVQTVTLKSALQDFIAFLVPHTNLVGHNIRSFDNRILLLHIMDQGLLSELECKVESTMDTLALVKALYPTRAKEYADKKLTGPYKQENLVKDLLNTPYDAHNALGDVTALQSLVSHCSLTQEIMLPHCITIASTIKYIGHSLKTKQNKDTLQTLIKNKILSDTMATKAASTGLCFEHLKLAYQRGGADQVKNLFVENTDSGIRVTKERRIIDNVVRYVESLYLGGPVAEQ